MPLKTPQCVYEVNVGLFRVLRNKGKSFSSGGYGVMYNSDKLGRTFRTDDDDDRMESKQILEQTSDDTLFLFVEETLFLKERSLLQVLKKDEVTPYTTSDLYRLMLQEHQIPLQVYLTYAHLRSQTFIVIRHTSDRIHYIHKLCHIHHKSNNTTTTTSSNNNHYRKNGELISNVGNATNQSPQLKQNQGGDSNIITHNHPHKLFIPNDDGEKGMDQRMVETTKNNNKSSCTLDWKEKRKQKKEMEQTVKKEFRKNSIEAPVPTVYNHKEDHINIAFDIYKPNASFSKMNPGVPDFYIAIFNFADPSPTFTTMMKTVNDCNDITLRLATVTDTGTVMVFGVTDFGVPSIK